MTVVVLMTMATPPCPFQTNKVGQTTATIYTLDSSRVERPDNTATHGLETQAQALPVSFLTWASRRALAWSSPMRGKCFLSPSNAAAATTPDCRMPPPSAFRTRRARLMKSSEPATAEPTGAPNPDSAARKGTAG